LSHFHISYQNSADEKSQFRTFKVIFRGQKLAELVRIFFSLKNIKLGDHSLLMKFFDKKIFVVELEIQILKGLNLK
jgi:hypothetical protein